MWKKEDDMQPNAQSAATPASRSDSRSGGAAAAVIGPSIRIQGELSGGEDLRVEGRVEGKISLPEHHVVVGEQGRVKADILGRTIRVEGQVQGNLTSREQVVVSRSGNVRGNITAPRVSLEDGAQFKGSIDMEPKAKAKAAAGASAPAPSDSAKGSGSAPRPEAPSGGKESTAGGGSGQRSKNAGAGR
ncbi:MAG: polymer-forming cytoskeletal protein [Acidobacteriota bacterium]